MDSQEWLDRRLADITPADFGEEILFLCTANLKPPKGFASHWKNIALGQQLEVTEEELTDFQALVIFANPSMNSDIQTLFQLIEAFDLEGTEVPPLFWAPHTSAPEPGQKSACMDFQKNACVGGLLVNGLDSIILGEPEGWGFVVAVQAKILKGMAMSKTLAEMLHEQRQRREHAEYLKECIDCMLWDYLRVRLAGSIPPVDYDIPRGDLTELDGFKFGEWLGKGTFGSVFRLSQKQEMPQRPADKPRIYAPRGMTEVMKVVDKAATKEVEELKRLKRMLDIMQLVSSDQWKHVNVVRFFEVYHSRDCLFFRMECGGSENLYRRLSYRQKAGHKRRPLPLARAASLLSQAFSVVAHLHSGPNICHRDLKPENTIIDDTPASLTLKLCDFDLAVIADQPGHKCRSPCGTIPFTAPEVLLDKEYDGQLADVWSLGVVFLEVLCGTRFLEHAVDLQSAMQDGTAKRQDGVMARMIRSHFEASDAVPKLLEGSVLPELMPLKQPMTDYLSGMMKVKSKDRVGHKSLKLWSQEIAKHAAGE